MSSSDARIFISYSRKDQAFVRSLHSALASHDVWVDWEDIPPTADFIDEIERAIEGVDTFIFVISPDSVTSPICRVELEHAVKHHKRLVPLVRRDTPTGDVPPEVARLNWIFWRAEDDPEAALALLATAIATDLVWVRSHTALLVRALEWEAKGRNSSLLLHGSSLREAEEWLASATDASDPQPTAVQRQYLLAGRRAANRRIGRLIGAAALATLIALTLAVVAFLQRNAAVEGRAEAVRQREVAETQREVAETQQRLAESRALAAGAVAQLPVDPELSLGLATEALAIAHTREAEDALRQGLGASHLRMTLPVADASVASAEFSPDGTSLLTSGTDGSVQLWDARTGAQRLALTLNEGAVTTTAFSADGSRIAAAGDTGTVTIWDTAGAEIASFRAHDGSVTAVSFSPDGVRLLTAGSDATARLWNPATGAGIAILTGHQGTIWSASYSLDGSRIVTGSDDGTAIVWDGESGGLLIRLEPTGPETASAGIVGDAIATAVFNRAVTRVATAGYDGTARVFDVESGEQLLRLENNQPIGTNLTFLLDLAISPDGAQIVTAANDGVARVWDAETGEKQMELRGHLGMVSKLDFSPDGHRIGSVSYDGTARIWDSRTGKQIAVMSGHTAGVIRLAFNPDGSRIVTGSFDGTARIWEAGTGAEGARIGPSDLDVAAYALSPDGTRILVLDVIGTVTEYDAITGEQITDPVVHREGDLDAWNTGAFSPDLTRLAMAGLISNNVVIWDPRTSTILTTLTGHTGTVVDVAFSPDGKTLATASYDGTAKIWDAATGDVLIELDHGTTVNAVDFSPDGRLLLTGADDGRARIWEIATGGLLLELAAAFGSSVDSVAFSPDGAHFITGAGTNVASVWDTASGELLTELRGHTELISSVAFSPDGRLALTGSWDASVRVWNAETGALLETLTIHPEWVTLADFSADGRLLVSAPGTGEIRVSRCDVCGSIEELLALVRERGTRPLTPEERARYLDEATPVPVASPVA